MILLAVTNHITQNISSVPFLWVLPLALYLVSFVLAFDHPRWYVRPLFITSFVVLLPAMAYFVPSLNLAVAAPLYLAGLFAVCMFCHGELARAKPDPAHLTRFYLMISLGGALGAALVAIVAPLTLPGYFELGIALIVLSLLLVLRLRGMARGGGVAVATVTVVFVAQGAHDYMQPDFAELMEVIRGNGPCNRQRMAHRRAAHEDGAWVRAAAAAYAAKRREPVHV